MPKSDVSAPIGTFPFDLRDVVFAAVSAAAIQLIGFLTIPLVLHIPVPGIRNIVSAPFSAMVLTLAAARIQKRCTVLLVMGLCSVVYALISPVIPAFVMTAAVVAELVNLSVFRGYASRRARMTTITVFYTAMTPIATLWGAWILGGEYRDLISRPTFMAGAALLVCLLSLAGAWVGERIAAELRRAGKMP
ncbi:MAG: hypothetical protein ACLFRG_11430 [Desulfococcaceae bacterium]